MSWILKPLILFLVLCTFFVSSTSARGLEIRRNDINPAYLVYEGKPVFAYGPSPQLILTYLPHGNGNKLTDWVEWASRFSINNVRSYPPSIRVPDTAEDLFMRSTVDPNKFDLNLFNDRYFKELRKACMLLRKHGMIVHLQLWQAVTWRAAWHDCYYNPINNVNPEISRHAGPGEFVTLKNQALLEHQKRYVEKILDFTADLGNVFYDIMNEIGNGTGTSERWVYEIIKAINRWEENHSIDVLLTLNDEGGRRMGLFSLECKGLDLAVKDLGRYDEHVNTRLRYLKPTVSVRNIDYDYQLKKRRYFAGKYNLEVNTDYSLQTRGRKYWWRMFMSGVQVAAAYADTYSRASEKLATGRYLLIRPVASYRLNRLAENNFLYFRKFVNRISDYEFLQPSSGVLIGHPVANSYCLQSMNHVIIYLESLNGRAGFSYGRTKAKLIGMMLSDGYRKGTFYYPPSGKKSTFSIKLHRGKGEIDIPPFEDDLSIIIR